MANELWLVPSFLATGGLLALAITLLVLKFESAANRTFAVLLLVRGLDHLMSGLTRLDISEATGRLLFDLWNYVLIAATPAILYFLLTYLGARHARITAAARVAVLVLFLAAGAWYAVDHCALQCTEGGAERAGPLLVLAYATPFATAVAAFLLARQFLRDPTEGCGAATLLVAGAFALDAVLESALMLTIFAEHGANTYAAFHSSPLVVASFALFAAAMIPALGALGVIAFAGRRYPRMKGRARNILVLAPLMAAASAIFILLPATPNFRPFFGNFILGAASMVLPMVVTYALLRHRLFNMDIRLRWTISRGFVAAVFLFTVLSVSQVVENVLDEFFGILAGGLATAVLLFAFTPMERMGRRLGHAIIPQDRPIKRMSDKERLELYADQARLVWSDGTMGKKERSILDQLRSRLGLSFEDAARLEHEAALGPTGGRRATRAGRRAGMA